MLEIRRKPEWLIALLFVLAPAIGSPSESLLQDTLKSIVVAFVTLAAVFLYLGAARKSSKPVYVHVLFWLPVLLLAYALGSMAWSHTYLAGVEAVRWLLFALLFFIACNVLDLSALTLLAWGIHIGAVIASLWTALQFWFDFSWFIQGPNPASTFINRNFFAEYLVCTLPFSVFLMTKLKEKASVYLLTFSLGFNIAALMMTGTRSALIALILLVLALPLLLWLLVRNPVSGRWSTLQKAGLAVTLVGAVLLCGSINSLNTAVLNESGSVNALDRAFARTALMTQAQEYTTGSFSIRSRMWLDTVKMIQAHPLAGVGAGAWEVAIPLFQSAGSELETDYYAHNEFLQLLAEYGLAGWLFLLALLAYLSWASVKTWTAHRLGQHDEAFLRATAIASLGALLLVSNAGFAWRMATTSAMFAASLAVLAASDIRLGFGNRLLLTLRPIGRQAFWIVNALLGIASVVAVYLTTQAVLCEAKLVHAVRISLMISKSGKPNDPRWERTKADMLQSVKEGIAINTHYRKITPMVADALASWGDWRNATWIWQSVLDSRPNVVAILVNVSRGHMAQNDFQTAEKLLDRAAQIQPQAYSVQSAKVELYSQTGREKQAAELAKDLLRNDRADYALVRNSYYLGMRVVDPELAIMALEYRIKAWPAEAADAWLKLGQIYSQPQAKNDAKASDAFNRALVAVPPNYRQILLGQIPPQYRPRH